MPVTKIPGCISCRQRHIRCDRGLPKCSGCTKSRKTRDCVYDAVRIRQSQHTAPPELSSEESNAIRFDCSPRGDQEDAEAAWRGGRTRPDQEEPDLGLQPILGDQLTPASSMEVFAEPTGLLQNLSSNSAHLISPELQSASAGQQPSPSLFSRDIQESPLSRLADSVVKVSDVVESRVFDFFIRVVGCWLDVASPARHFSRTVAQLATTEPAIYYACLTYASRVCYLQGHLEKEVTESFHEKAIHLLIQLLSEDQTSLKTDVVVATTVVLRMWEQLYETHSDGQFHLNCAFSVFVRPGLSWSTSSSDLKGCAFWLFVRQNIRASFLHEQAVQCDLSYVKDEAVYEPALDEVWTNRITLLLARLCSACWGELMLPVRHELFLTLEACLKEWKRCLPPSFKPWSNIKTADNSFPIIRYLCTWHTLAWHFYYTAKILLAVYNPKRPTNQNIIATNQYINQEIVTPAHVLCAICFSDTDTGTGINGVHLLGWCGQFFTGSVERRCLRDYMQTFMEEHKWPNQACIARLERAWYGTTNTP